MYKSYKIFSFGFKSLNVQTGPSKVSDPASTSSWFSIKKSMPCTTGLYASYLAHQMDLK